jgi:DnaJ-class molecular chaperone
MCCNRWLIACVLVTCGCAQPPLHTGDAAITADLACETAHMLIGLKNAPPPAPAPVSDKCENCNGTGRVGDGRVSVTCPVCKGSGKPIKSVLVPRDCPDGKCRP